LPEDVPPADMGSYKGYTNRYTFSQVGDDFHVPGTVVTYNNESEDMSVIWSDGAKVGCIGGFGVFGVGIILVVGAIAMDMRKRMQMYEDYI